jgi:glutamate 5-kinase
VAEGCVRLGWQRRPEAIHELQAAAAVGQMGLVQAYESALSAHGTHTAMVMLTHDDLADRQRYLNARATLHQLLNLGVVPVINENDTVATDEIRFGDNDTLAALVANLLEAELLVILTDVEGLMDGDPRVDATAQRVSFAYVDDARLDALPGDAPGELGRGGMVTKVRASRLAARSGAHTIIASGRQPEVLRRILAGDDTGTLLAAQLSPMNARKRWIAGHLRAKGDLTVDRGAAEAIRQKGVSLLAVGVIAVEGIFQRGDVVRVIDPKGVALAHGLSNYSSQDVSKLLGVKSSDFGTRIEFVSEPELVHRDNLVVL